MNTVPTVLEGRSITHAQRAPRCTHVRYNGDTCNCPALKGEEFCRFHQDARVKNAQPILEDAAALPVSIMRIVGDLETGALDSKQATARLYALQLASANLSRLAEEMPVQAPPLDGSVPARVMAILDPPMEKYATIYSQVLDIVALL
jgi:hypothetical protein